jgi:hypothetical protein
MGGVQGTRLVGGRGGRKHQSGDGQGYCKEHGDQSFRTANPDGCGVRQRLHIGGRFRKIDIFVTSFLEVEKARQFAAAADPRLAAGGAQALIDRGFRTPQARRDGLDGMPGDQQAQNLHFPVGKTRRQAGKRVIRRHGFCSPQRHRQVHPNLFGKWR